MATHTHVPQTLEDDTPAEPLRLHSPEMQAWLTQPLSPEEIERRRAATERLDAVVRELAAKAGLTEEEFREIFSQAYLESSNE